MTYEPSLSDEELKELDRRIAKALRERSVEGLQVLGMGEAGLALAWPDDQPTAVVKRLWVSDSAADAQAQFERIREYISRLAPFVEIAPTDLRAIVADSGRTIPFIVQPLYPKEQLVEHVLEVDEPSSDHPIVTSLTEAIVLSGADGRQALDGQFTNFAWVENKLVFFDLGSPFMYDENGNAEDVPGVLDSLPAILRPVLRKQVQGTMNRLGGRRYTFRQAAISLPRIGQDRWLVPALNAFNEHLDDPLTVEEIHTRISRMYRELKVMKSLMRVQRAWAVGVRRRPYETFITDSFTGELT